MDDFDPGKIEDYNLPLLPCEKITPPTYSTRVAGEVQCAQILDFPLKHKRERKLSAGQKLGLAYEKKVLRYLSEDFPDLQPHPALLYYSRGLRQYAIPDAINVDEELQIVNVFEIKLKHSSDAWHQLMLLYLPIILKIFPNYHINPIEICRSYNPNISLPGEVLRIESLKDYCSRGHRAYGIFLYTGR